MTDNPHIGSTLEEFLQEEGRLEEATATAIKRVLEPIRKVNLVKTNTYWQISWLFSLERHFIINKPMFLRG